MTQGSNSKEVLNNRRRPRVVLLPVENLIIEEINNTKSNSSITMNTFWEDNPTYGDLFVNLLIHRDWLCLGLYRLRDNASTRPISQSNKRVVLCSPPRTFPLFKTDLVKMKSIYFIFSFFFFYFIGLCDTTISTKK